MGGGLTQSGSVAKSSLMMRAATKADLDAIVRIVKAGFPDDPGCVYNFPYRSKHSEDFWKWSRVEYEQYPDQPEKFASLVVTAPFTADDKTIDIPILNDRGIDVRHDANPKDMRAYRIAISRGLEEYFTKYGAEQASVRMLVTDPNFRDCGAATMLCKWGMEQAKQKGWITTIFAGLMGNALYEYLGYKQLGMFAIQMEGQDELNDIFAVANVKSER